MEEKKEKVKGIRKTGWRWVRMPLFMVSSGRATLKR